MKAVRITILSILMLSLVLFLVLGCGEKQQDEATPDVEAAGEQQPDHINPDEIQDRHVGMRPPDVIESQDVDELPQPLTPIRAAYPDTAQKLGFEGTVILDLLIDGDGAVRLVEFVQHAEEGGPVLDKAAVMAAKVSTWKPAMKDGVPVQAWTRVPIEFKLRDEKPAKGN